MDATLLGFRVQVGAPGCLGLTDAAASSFPIARAPMVAGNSLPIKMLKLASPPAGWPLATSLLTSLVCPRLALFRVCASQPAQALRPALCSHAVILTRDRAWLCDGGRQLGRPARCVQWPCQSRDRT